MLKSELIRPQLKMNSHRVWPRQLPRNYRFLTMAKEVAAIFEAYQGQTRGELVAALRDYEGDSLDYPIIRGLAAVVENQCQFGNTPLTRPEEIRAALFQKGPVTYKADLFNQKTRLQALNEVAEAYQTTVHQLESDLFADLQAEQLLLAVKNFASPGDLIDRYNLEIARGLLYWASEVEIILKDTYKDVFKYIKLFKLMHTVEPLNSNDGYRITLHGPISPFVKSTMRYGLQFAKFLPALLLCTDWQMIAQVRLPRSEKTRQYHLDDQTELRSHFKSSGDYDSQLEADFAADFAEKYDGPKRKWTLTREDELITVGDSVFIPDFTLTHHQDGRKAIIEIVGFWHPNYLRRKLQKVRDANLGNLILIVYQSANVAEGAFEAVSSGEVLQFKRKPVLKEVLAAVERIAR